MVRRSKDNLPQKRMGVYVAYILIICSVIYGLVLAVRTIQTSLMLEERDRLNIVFYGDQTHMLSLGMRDNVNYIVHFALDQRVAVPGGYGRYNVGAVGKLAALEKNPVLVQRTFSSMVSAYVDYYVIPVGAKVYTDSEAPDAKYSATRLARMLFDGSSITNASFLDRLYIAFQLYRRRGPDYILLSDSAQEGKNGVIDFSEKRFLKKYKGFFYSQILRNEAKQVTVMYDSYPGALTISRVIEGEGIRVADLAKSKTSLAKRCRLVSGDIQSATVAYLRRQFDCEVREGASATADIVMIMGSALTEEWK